nr:alpha/beta hydrolase [Pseudoclavibacter chungangensis]
MSEDARSMLMYIHGFGATMRSAAESAARLSVAIKHPGATAMFSWASRANVLRYWDDERTVDASGAALDEFLQTLATVDGVDHIDLVVHSLGNRLFLRTLVERVRSGAVLPWPLRNLFLGAPDIDQSEFLNDASAYGQARGTMTLYGSNSDTALLISSLLHQTARAGLMPPPVLTDGVDTIETSGIDSSWLRHSGILESPVIHADIAQIRSGITDPDDRTGLHRVDATPVPYWRY